MTEQILSLVHGPAGIQHVRGERMSQLVRPGRRIDARRRAAALTISLTASSRIGAPAVPRNKFTNTKSPEAAAGTASRSNS